MDTGLRTGKVLFYFLSLFVLIINSYGQDVQFSQFYAAQTFLNPGYVGSAHAHRAMFHQRIQWPTLDAKFVSSLVSYDFFSHKYQSGYGIMFFHDYLGDNNISSSEIHFQYAYELPISKQFSVRPGLQLGLVSRYLNYADLTFPHQFQDVGQVMEQNLYGNFGKERKLYPDVASGFVLYSDDFWFSASGHHLNLPNQSVTGQVARLPMRFTFASGYKIHLKQKPKMAYLNEKEEFSITPVIHYKFQGKSDQTDVGLYFTYNQLLTGAWYRGIPFKRYEYQDYKFHNNESVVLLVGWMYGNFSFSYSYDFTLSTLRPAKTRGAHEINITYIHHHKKGNKPRKRLPCPSFYK